MSAEPQTQIELEIGHILFIDVVGYSKLSINQQRTVIDELTELVRASDQYQKAESASRLIKIPTGDGMALVFYKSPEEPVECALEISRALKENRQLRMGVHSGPVSGVIDVNGQANLAGAGLNMAQRVMDCGDAGHILLSKRVADDLGEYEHWRPLLHDLGECEVKHGVKLQIVNLFTDETGNRALPAKLRVQRQGAARTRSILVATSLVLLAVVAAAFVAVSRRAARSNSAVPEKSIAVLPFENRSEDKANAYFADGIQDEILTRLAKIGTLKVISRTSTERYKTAPANLSEIARQLGVAHLLEGSVQKTGKQVRVNVQLIKAVDDSHLWAETYDRNLSDIFSVESEVATAIAEKLKATLTGSEKQAVTNRPTDNLEAYDAYLRGLEFHRRTELPADRLEAERYLKLAVSLDPNFALAWARLGRVEAGLYYQDYDATPARRATARNAVEQAARLQPDLGESWLATGYFRLHCERDLAPARVAFEKARERLPNDSEVLMALSVVALHSGRAEDDLALLAGALQLDPRNPILFFKQAEAFLALRQFPEARAAADRALAITPQNAELSLLKAVAFQSEGDLAPAKHLFATLPESEALLGTVHPGQANELFFARRYGDVISLLLRTAGHRNAAALFTRDLSSWLLGSAQKLSGDMSGAQSTFAERRDALLREIEKSGGTQGGIHSMLALMYAGVGDKANALREAKRGLELEGDDSYLAPAAEEVLAIVEVATGEGTSALDRLPRLLKANYVSWLYYAPLTPALLRLDPAWDPIRNDPRFQKLVAPPASK